MVVVLEAQRASWRISVFLEHGVFLDLVQKWTCVICNDFLLGRQVS